jgi:hypothetical protein
MFRYTVHNYIALKRQYHEIFDLWFLHQTIPTRSLIHALQSFRILLRIRQEIIEYVLPHYMWHSAGPFLYRICMKRNMYGPALCRTHSVIFQNRIRAWGVPDRNIAVFVNFCLLISLLIHQL